MSNDIPDNFIVSVKFDHDMDLDEFDFGLPEAPGSQLSAILNEPEAVSPYSDVGMMEDINSDTFNPFSQIQSNTFSPLEDVSMMQQPVQQNAPSHDLSSLGFEAPSSGNNNGAPAFVVDKGGIAIHKWLIPASVICLVLLCLMAILVMGMYALALSKLIQIDDDVNHLRLNVPRVW